MAGFTAAAAVISYNDGLFLIRYAGVAGWVAYLYPLLPDGLIVISSASLYEAALTGVRRPRWAMTGLVLGASLTLAMNLAAGLAVSRLLAAADSVVPVVFFFALEILIGLIRRAQITPRATPAATPRTAPAIAPGPRQPAASDRAKARAKAVRLLAASPGMPLADVARQSGVSQRTASRIKSALPVPLRVAGGDHD
jgi:hypothetical protein